MSNRVFLFFCLLLVFGIQLSYFAFKAELDGSEILAVEVELLKKELEKEKARTQLAQFQHESYKQLVASKLPKNIPSQDYAVRSLASLTRTNENLSLIQQDYERKFQEIRKVFLEKKYELAAKLSESFIETYPDSVHIQEAYFLYLSSLYESKQYEKSLHYIDIMVENFPDSELTGFSLLTMAEIFIKQERQEDAKNVLEVVIKNFKFPEIKKSAQKRIKEIEI